MSATRPCVEDAVGHDHMSLKDWLIYTRFHDDTYREQELVKFRSLRETIRAIEQEIKELEETVLQLRLQHIPVYREHKEMEKREADLFAHLEQLRKDRTNAAPAAERLTPVVLPPLQETSASPSQDAPVEEGEVLDDVIHHEQYGDFEQCDHDEQYGLIEQYYSSEKSDHSEKFDHHEQPGHHEQPDHHERHDHHEQHNHHEQNEHTEQQEQFTQSTNFEQSRRTNPALSRSPSLVLSPGSSYHSPSREGNDRSNYPWRGRQTLGHNKSRDRTRSPDVMATPRNVNQGYRARSRAPSYTGYDGSSSGPSTGAFNNTRFFVLKSAVIENVYKSQDENIWACGFPTVEKLSEAFESCNNVILIFSANRSFGFQGYARMVDLPSPHNPKPSWYSRVKWRISDPFHVEWICTTSCTGDKTGGMRNSLVPDPQNPRGQLVVRSRDGDELDAPSGHAMKCILDQEARGAAAAQR